MTAPMKAPRLIRWPLRVQPIPFPAVPPPAIALIRGVMTLSVKALTKVLKASATTRPTAMMIKSPCIKKFLKPFSIPVPSSGVRLVTATAPYTPTTARRRANVRVPAGLSAGGTEALGLDGGRSEHPGQVRGDLAVADALDRQLEALALVAVTVATSQFSRPGTAARATGRRSRGSRVPPRTHAGLRSSGPGR